MDAIQTIMTRRSVRQFTDEPVSQEDLTLLLKAGFQAPSAGNARPCHFIVLTDRSVLDQIPLFHSSAAFLPKTPLGILICADQDIAKPGRWVQDGSVAGQNILLAAHAQGLGACWIGIQPVAERIEGFRKLCRLPEQVNPVCLIAVGHALKVPPPEDRYNPQRVHQNAW